MAGKCGVGEVGLGRAADSESGQATDWESGQVVEGDGPEGKPGPAPRRGTRPTTEGEAGARGLHRRARQAVGGLSS
jgi:hypothetical protein